MSSPFGSTFGGVTKHPTRAGLTLPRTNLLAYFRGGVDTIGESTYLLDSSGNNYHALIVSGSSWGDWVFTLPAEAALIAADDGTFFTAGAPNEVAIADLYHFVGDQIFFDRSKGLAVYADELIDPLLFRADRYFHFNGELLTVDSEPLVLDQYAILVR